MTSKKKSKPTASQVITRSGMPGFSIASLVATLALVLTVVVIASGCFNGSDELKLDDLTMAERQYVQRVVTLERAKAVVLVDSDLGYALLDSLALAWGDSSRERTLAASPSTPQRSQAVGKLLLGILEAENDSLIHSPRPDRLDAPLPQPIPAE